MNYLESGSESMEVGNFLGILLLVMKGWQRIWSRVILLLGSSTKAFEIKFLALKDTEVDSLNVYWHSLILL
jgi:hypothetical protein